jgi:hypothetical protein
MVGQLPRTDVSLPELLAGPRDALRPGLRLRARRLLAELT